MMPRLYSAALAAVAVFSLTVLPAAGAPKPSRPDNLSGESVNNAEWPRQRQRPHYASPLLVKLQVLLDRAHASPGQIDAINGENTRKAIAAFRAMHGLGGSDRADLALWRQLTEADGEPALIPYAITKQDVEGPFIEKLPDDYREKADLKKLAYTSSMELLAEKFHMSEKLLQQLNPDVAFDRAGVQIVVANVQRQHLSRKVARVKLDAATQRVLAYDRVDRLVAVYPATVGSRERPTPHWRVRGHLSG